MARVRAGTWAVVALVAAVAGGCRARDAAVEEAEARLGTNLPLGSACASAGECASGFCIDSVCCNSACGGGVRDLLSCSNLYGPVTGLTDGTCTALRPGDPCGALATINPCTWRGSIVNNGFNCPNPPGTTGIACYPCSDSSQCGGAFAVCVNDACVECDDNADCGAGRTCNTTLGNCGRSCGTDGDCDPAAEWCSNGACTAKFPNGSALPAIAPIDATCTSENGARVCLSGLCDPVSDACVGCRGDGDCGASDGGVICDPVELACTPGCRGTGGNGCPADRVCSSTDERAGACLSVEGGGPGCSVAAPVASGAAQGTAWITLALLGLALRAVRRWRP